MKQQCPSCGAETPVSPGDLSTCTECAHRFLAEDSGEVPFEFELQRAKGDRVEGPFDRLTLREMLYTGALTGSELVRRPGQTHFSELALRPEFAEVLSLLGKEPAAPRGERRIAGWKAAKETTGATGAPAAAEERTRPPAPPKRAGNGGGGLNPVLVGGALVLVALVVLGGLLLLGSCGL